ncbi:hypothetical protein [Williamsia sp.]|uniref:hypothetical protein n=1 Tax=Williamsia sp. TaxID=1872085 RepID=UPI001A2EAEED|nr:hypothetical protein [Williamsia sp.]MBJ7291706.1 hypothetical protein [Williamsia sp.]
MRTKLIGSVFASLMVAGAVVAMNPGVAMADVAGYTGVQLVDPSGADRGLDSPFGSKVKIYVAVDSTDRVTCSLALTPAGADKPSYKTTFSLRSDDNFSAGGKVTSKLKTNQYAGVVTCRNSKETLYTNSFDVNIQNAPPLVFSGTATCFDSAKEVYVRPKGLDVAVYESTYKVPLRNASTGEDRASTSTFSYETYDNTLRPTLKCLGTAAKPGYTTTFDNYSLPATGVVLRGGQEIK